MQRTRKRSRRRNHKKRGGALLAQGAQGCVFDPALRCSDEQTPAAGVLSKLMKRTPALLTELQLASRLASVDPKQRYTLYASKSCSLNPKNVETRAENLQGCRIIQKSQQEPFDPFGKENTTLRFTIDNYALLQSPHGGQDLLTISNTGLSDWDEIGSLFGALRNLIVGLQHLHSKGLYHLDIKPENIVVSETGAARFIDFGLSAIQEELHERLPLYNALYFLFPLEFRFVGIPASDLERLLEPEARTELIPHLTAFYTKNLQNSRIPTDLYWTPENEPKLNEQFVQHDILQPLLDHRRSDSDEGYGYMAAKADIYALGLTLYCVPLFMFNLYIRNGVVYEMQADGTMVSLVSRQTEPTPLRQLKRQFLKAFGISYIYLCYGMMNPAVEQRMSLDSALAEYDRILEGLKQFLDPLAAPAEPVVSMLAKRSRPSSSSPSPSPSRNNNGNAAAPPTKRQKTRRYRRISHTL